MESGKLHIILHSGGSLTDVKFFGTMDPYAVVWIAGNGKQSNPRKTEVSKKGASSPVWDCTMEFKLTSVPDSYTLFCEIKHHGKLVDRHIGQAQVPFKDLLAGDATGDHVSYPVKMSSGEVKGEIVISHKFSQPEGTPTDQKDYGGGGKVAGSRKKVQKKKEGRMKRVLKKAAAAVAAEAVVAGLVGLVIVPEDEEVNEDEFEDEDEYEDEEQEEDDYDDV